MPELPEVEVLVRHLAPLLKDKVVRDLTVRRPRVLRPTSPRALHHALRGAKFQELSRRGKYLVFTLRAGGRGARAGKTFWLIGHLGMTGRMYLAPIQAALPKHAAVVIDLGRQKFIFEDTRYFGRLTLDAGALEKLGPEPLSNQFSVEPFANALSRSTQPVKIKLLDQSLVAGVGNIYASEALFRAGISPSTPARELSLKQVRQLWKSIRHVLSAAIKCGSTVPLNYGSNGDGAGDGLFYFGSASGTESAVEERLHVYDRAGQPCGKCGHLIAQIVQAGRSTYFCRKCQRA